MSSITTAKRLNIFSEYVFSKLGKKVKEIETQFKRKVLNFGPGNPDVIPSQLYLDKLNQFTREKDAHLYPGYGANPEFAQALIHLYKH